MSGDMQVCMYVCMYIISLSLSHLSVCALTGGGSRQAAARAEQEARLVNDGPSRRK